MSQSIELDLDQQFALDVERGLTSQPKFLQSKYFYNAKGDELFQEIMNLEEYYLTRAEYQVFEQRKDAILSKIKSRIGDQSFELVELGAGDGYKTKILIRHFLDKGVDFQYIPIDISANVLEGLKLSLGVEVPSLEVRTNQGDYFDALAQLDYEEVPKVILQLGSNIGNFDYDDAVAFLKKLASHMKPFDHLLLGIDLKKEPSKILAAYNDKRKVTAEFNLNLLDRINEELGANFDRDEFLHNPTYDPISGECRSYLVSKTKQTVNIEAIHQTVKFEAWEPILMEISRKYSVQELSALADTSGLEIEEVFTDDQEQFADVMMKLKTT